MVPEYPGAALVLFITGWAFEHGQMPDEVYEKYLKNPQNFVLLSAYGERMEEKRKEEEKKAKAKSR